MLSAEAVSAWHEVLEKVEKKTTAQQFATWFRNLQVQAITDTKVSMAVPSTFHRDWIATYYRDVLETAVAEVFNGPREIQLNVVKGEVAGPAAPPRKAAAAPAPEAVAVAPARAPSARPKPAFEVLLTEGMDFDHLVDGPANQLAKAAGISLSRGTQSDFSAMMLVGSTGLGKTHLLQAICRDALAHAKGRRVAYLRAEAFVNDFIQAVAEGQSARFRERYRNLDFVCFDDLQVLSGKGHTQTEFSHTLTAWMDRGARVVLAARCAPGDPLDVDPSLLQQLSAAFRVSLKHPSVEMRRAIVVQNATARKENLPEDVVEFLADLPVANVRELEGAVTSVIASSRLRGVEVNLRSARAALQDDALVQRPVSSPDRILNTVCKHFEVKLADVVSARRPQALSFARQVAMFLLRERTALSLSEIGELLGGRDHTTILHGIRKVERSLEKDSRLQDHVSRLRLILDHY